MSACQDPVPINLGPDFADRAELATLTVPGLCNGPIASGNGGWTAGALARHLPPGPVSVALRAPVPLDQAMRLLAPAAGASAPLQLWAQALLVAEAEPATLVLAMPEVPSVAACEAAGALGRLKQSGRPADSPYARCFVCGFDRPDGLQLAPGPVDTIAARAAGLVATTWVPAAALVDMEGAAAAASGRQAATEPAVLEAQVRAEAVWAALDCPAGMAWGEQLPADAAMVTVRITAVIDRPVRPGQRYRVLAWPVARDGRKLQAGTALVDDAGEVCAHSHQLWLLPRGS